MTGRIARVQALGAWLRRRQRSVAAAALGVALVVLAIGERSSLEHRALYVSMVSALCVVIGIVAGPWVGLSVAVVAGAVSIVFILPFDDAVSIVASLAAVGFWALASMGAGFVSDYYRRQVAVRQREVDERQRLGFALNEIGSAIASGLDRESLLPRIVRLAGEALDADSAAVLDHCGAHWRVDYGWAIDGDLVGRELTMDPGGIAAALEATRAPLSACIDGEHGLRSRELDELSALAALVVPLLHENRVGGALVILMHARHRHWTMREIEFAQKVSTDLSAALQNVSLYEAQLRIATTLQEQMIHALPRIDGLELAAVSQAAFQPELVGGDFYDVLELPDGALSLLIGDVEGKGVRAAGLTERVRTMVRTLWLDSSCPADVLTKANHLLQGDAEGQHVTVLLARLRLPDGALELAAAGHPPPVHCDTRVCRLLTLQPGPPLGAFDWRYEQVPAALAPGETLVLFTDGVIEARRAGELFGERRLLETVRRHRDAPVAADRGRGARRRPSSRGDAGRRPPDPGRAQRRREAGGQGHDLRAANGTVKSPAESSRVHGAALSRLQRSSPEPERVEMRVGRAADLRRLRSLVGSLVTSRGVPADTRDEIVLAVQEAVKNGLASCDGGGDCVVVRLRCDDRACFVEVRDPGPGFDLAAAERRTLDPTAEHGRGLLLMRRLMDSLSVHCDGCCTVVMTRRFVARH